MVRPSHLLPLAVALFVSSCASGCYPIGGIMYKLAGPLPVEALYVPDDTKPMLVFVERFNTGGGGGAVGGIEAQQECEGLARAIQAQLNEKQIAPQVDPMAVSQLRVKDPMKFRAMTVSQIGGELGAQQVLYVNVLASSMKMSEGSELIRGQMAGNVKVIDVATGEILWPTDAGDGHPVAVQTPITSVREGVSPGQARASMIRQMGDAVAKLFYKWKPDYETPPE
jgi:hypothetical protein